MLTTHRSKRVFGRIPFFILLILSCIPTLSVFSFPSGPSFISKLLSLFEVPQTIAGSDIPTSTDEIQRITPEELKRLMEDGVDILVVDNQPKSAYDFGHINGAINFSWAIKIEDEDTWRLPKDMLLIFYCACTHEEDAADMAMQLITKFGYKNIKLLEGGWSRWLKLGYPIEKVKKK